MSSQHHLSDSPVLVYRHVDSDGQERALDLGALPMVWGRRRAQGQHGAWQSGNQAEIGEQERSLGLDLPGVWRGRDLGGPRGWERRGLGKGGPGSWVERHMETLGAESRARLAKLMPAALLESRFRQAPSGRGGISLLAHTEPEVHVEHAPVSARHLVTVVSTPV